MEFYGRVGGNVPSAEEVLEYSRLRSPQPIARSHGGSSSMSSYAVTHAEGQSVLPDLRAQGGAAAPDALLPRLRARHRAQADRARHRRAGHTGPHHADQPGGLLGLRLLLFRRRQHPGGARARAGGGHGGQAQLPGKHGAELSGRWRPGRHRLRRDRARRQSRRAHHGDLHQQRHLWHDRRPDGAHHAAGREEHHVALRPQPVERRLSRCT